MLSCSKVLSAEEMSAVLRGSQTVPGFEDMLDALQRDNKPRTDELDADGESFRVHTSETRNMKRDSTFLSIYTGNISESELGMAFLVGLFLLGQRAGKSRKTCRLERGNSRIAYLVSRMCFVLRTRDQTLFSNFYHRFNVNVPV